MKVFSKGYASLALTFMMLVSNPLYSQNGEGIFEAESDIGECLKSGSSDYDPEGQTYTLTGSGANMWETRDDFHYLWTTLQGDFILRAEIEFSGEQGHAHRKAGWDVRNNLKSNSAHVSAALHGDGLTALQWRREDGDMTMELRSPDTGPAVVQMERKGNTWIMSTASFGEELTAVSIDSLPLDREVYVGLYVCAHDAESTETAIFRNVRIIIPAPEGFVPYRDYLGSHLEILDIETGLRKVVHTTAHSIQAPNWTSDGNQLIYNSKGLIYRFGIDDGVIEPLNTGFATRNNNDHVLNSDGTLLGISNHSPEEEGASTIYYLPSSGATDPVRVTRKGVGASYLHGWSPDGSSMVFTGERQGQYDIYRVNILTGEETRLTDQKLLDDGPEYSPDGEYVFFNSARTGKMQIWKMDASGENQVQVTFDEYNNWFPHVSPNQQWIVFLSFPADIDPGDHPFYKQCMIRVIPFEGGEPQVVAYIYGGQGSINVPSWSPDSRKIAFVTNTGFWKF